MNIVILLLVLSYTITCFFFHQVMLKCYADDDDPALKDIPVWFIKTGLFLGSLIWPILALITFIHAKVKDK